MHTVHRTNVFKDLASAYDRGMLLLELLIFRRLRRRIFPRLRGAVLELGVGTGVNLPLYEPEARVTGCDASRDVMIWSTRRPTQASVTLAQADAQRLPFADGSFDVVTGSLVFCSIADPAQGLAEARRVLRRPERSRRAEGRPGGRLILLEHTRGSGLGAWLTVNLHPLWDTWSHECRLNRETVQSVAVAGFHVQQVEKHALGIVRVIEAVVQEPGGEASQ